jgi:arginase
MNFSKQKKVKRFGVPIDLGAKPLGVEMGPTAIRCASLAEALQYNDIEYIDYGDSKINREIHQEGFIEEIARISEELQS